MSNIDLEIEVDTLFKKITSGRIVIGIYTGPWRMPPVRKDRKRGRK